MVSSLCPCYLSSLHPLRSYLFSFNHPPLSLLFPLSLHDALPICKLTSCRGHRNEILLLLFLLLLIIFLLLIIILLLLEGRKIKRRITIRNRIKSRRKRKIRIGRPLEFPSCLPSALRLRQTRGELQ